MVSCLLLLPCAVVARGFVPARDLHPGVFWSGCAVFSLSRLVFWVAVGLPVAALIGECAQSLSRSSYSPQLSFFSASSSLLTIST